MDGVRVTSPFLDLAIVMSESIPPGFRVRAGFDTGRGAAETGRAWGVPAAGEPAVYFFQLILRVSLLVFLLVSTAVGDKNYHNFNWLWY